MSGGMYFEYWGFGWKEVPGQKKLFWLESLGRWPETEVVIIEFFEDSINDARTLVMRKL
jgi:hypothetical protein